jgi:hypothetical protein
MGGVVLGSGATGSMDTAMMQGVDYRPAARAVVEVPRLMGVRRPLVTKQAAHRACDRKFNPRMITLKH